LPSTKSSTIHSAFVWHNGDVELRDLATTVPVVRFSMTALPEFAVFAVTVSLMVSPAWIEIPPKSCA
jgi:hypothetical protein